MEFEKTSIDVWGIRIMEPVTCATDLIVSVVCFYAFLKIHRSRKEQAFAFFKFYFLLMGVATVYGAIIGHAFFYRFSQEWKIPGWIISMISIALFERAVITHAEPLLKPVTGKFFLVMNISELCIFIFIVLHTLTFVFVEAHAAYGLMVSVFSFELFILLKKKDEGSGRMLLGIFISALAAIVHLTRFTIHPWFNHLDLSHVIMAVAAFVFYRGVMQIEIYEKK